MSRKLLEKPFALMQRFRTGSDSQLTDGMSPTMSTESSDENKENDVCSKSKKKDSSTNRSIWYISSDRVGIALSEPVSSVPSAISDPSAEHQHVERKVSRSKPKGTIEIEVPLNGTLNSIAAHYDTTPSELIKLNKLGSRMVFPGQMLLIPDPDYVSSSEPSSPDLPPSPVFSPSVLERPRVDIPIVRLADKFPAKFPGHVERQTTPVSSPQEKKQIGLIPQKLSEEDVQSLDHECYERFIKINVKHITDGQISRDRQGNASLGVVNGTLLVTPNAVMFDPNVSDPLVIEHGSEKYGMITPMDMVISAAMYHDIAAMRMRGRKDEDQVQPPKHAIYHAKDCPLHHSGSSIFHPDELDADSTIRHSTTTDSLSSSTTACSCGALSREQSLNIEPDETIEKHLYFQEPTSDEISNQTGSDRVKSRLGSIKTNVDSVSQSVGITSQSVHSVGLSPNGAEPSVDGALPSAECTDLKADRAEPFTDSAKPSADSAEAAGDWINSRVDGLKAVGNNRNIDTNIPRVVDANLGVDSAVVEDIGVTTLVGGSESNNFAESKMGGMLSELSGKANENKNKEDFETSRFNSTNFDKVDKNDNTEFQVPNRNRKEIRDVSNDASVAEHMKSPGLSEVSKKTPAHLTLSVDSKETSAHFTLSKDSMTTVIKSLNLPNTSLGEVKSENIENSESRIGNIVYLPVEENCNGEMVVKGTDSTSFGDVDSQVPSSGGSDSNVGVRAIKSSAQHLSSFVNYATGLFRSNVDDRLNVKDISEVMVTSAPTHTASDSPLMVLSSSPKGYHHLEVSNAIRLEDKPELFQTFDKLIARPATHAEDPPLYLCLRVGHPKNKEVSQTCPIESYRSNKKKPEYWFSIPRAKVDALYAFFVQWTPDIYGDEDEIDPEIRGFVVIEEEDDTPDENLEIIDEHFASIQKFRKDWEIISKEEARRRMSVDEDYFLLPELEGETKLLSEEHIRELSRNLPPRTIGYTWTLIYSTELNGFSLKTLYRYMSGIDSPILLVVTDTTHHVFGAVTSCALKISDHFYGTGESFLFTFYPEFKVFHWTGENNFFIKGNQESLAIGAGQGLFGLWFDGDLYHGRSHKCETFDNDVLTDTEDFVVKGLEAWAFI